MSNPAETLRAARARYFEENGFGKDGGYADAWVDFKLGPLPLPFPNTRARVRAVRYHDLHHVLTGYPTDLRGEFEISAWEIGAGCKNFLAAWQLNLSGLLAGTTFMPRRIFRAFLRGRRSHSLYGLPLEPLLDESVAGVRARTGILDASGARRESLDLPLFVLAALAGVPIGLAQSAFVFALLPFGLATLAVRRLGGRTARRDPN